MYFRAVLIIGVMLCCFHSVNADTDSLSKSIPIVTETFPPFEYELNGEVVGSDTRVVRQVLKRMGYQADIKLIPWVRAQKYTQLGRVAAIYSLTKSPEREQYLYFSDPISYVQDMFFKRADRDIQWQVMADLSPYTIGVSKGYSYPQVFMAALKRNQFKKVTYLTGETLELRHLRRLKAGFIDLSICEISVCQYLIQQHAPEFDMIDVINQPVGERRSYHIAFSKNWPNSEALLAAFNSELKTYLKERNP
ncbi:substrate-binding periplasmic protein [Litoribacillus peritrichatus]|uniref:Transporter substrate-binding domain-containing protein n=1 Tax=Litoribacillus peritrichatus TaxID=718191 RepID=A0ABP7MDW8_9GAMM